MSTREELIELKKRISQDIEKNITSSFFSRGRDYCLEESIIRKLYDIYTGKTKYTYIYDFEDKVEIKKAYPSFFEISQKTYHWKITKKLTSCKPEDRRM